MAEHIKHYKNLTERKAHVATAQNNGYVMLHDDFDPDWKPGDEHHGTLTFDLPAPKSAEELEEEARVTKLQDLINKPSRTNAENTQMLDLLAAKQGIELPVAKYVIKKPTPMEID